MPNIGRYANGDRFVLSPCKITAMTPDCVTEDAPNLEDPQTNVIKHGAMMNFGYDINGQGYTDRAHTSISVPYNEAENARPPLTFQAGEEGTIEKSVFLENGDKQGRPMIKSTYALTVVAQEPLVGAFRPAPSLASKVSLWKEADMIDLNTLPKLPILGGPSPASVISVLRWPQPVAHGVGNKYEKLAGPTNVGGNPYKSRIPAKMRAAAVLLLCSDIPLAQKRDLAVCIVQAGIDILGRSERMLATGSSDWGGEGGANGLGGVSTGNEKILLLTAGLLMQDQTMLDRGNPTIRAMFAEDGNSTYVTQGMIDGTQVPSAEGRPVEQYVQGDLGTPEWTEGNIYKGHLGNRPTNATYRAINIPYRVRTALACHIFPGLKAAWNNQAFFDYADRVMERDFFEDPQDPGNVNKLARTYSGTDSLTSWDVAMWDAYRVSEGPAIWDWPV